MALRGRLIVGGVTTSSNGIGPCGCGSSHCPATFVYCEREGGARFEERYVAKADHLRINYIFIFRISREDWSSAKPQNDRRPIFAPKVTRLGVLFAQRFE